MAHRTLVLPFAVSLICLALDGCCGNETLPGAPARPPLELTGHGLDVPIVFVSRECDGRELGVEAQGRELRPGGRLVRMETDGTVGDLVSSPLLFDVARPSVSFNGEWIAFSGIRHERDLWSIYRVPADGGEAEQITRPHDNPVQDFIDTADRVDSRIMGVGDFSPIWLPDGRIAFLSTRYPTLAASCGERMTNLYVMEADGKDIRRISTTRSGVVDPSVLRDGRIVVSYYHDNMNEPRSEGAGLRPIVGDRHWQDRYWMIWAMNPDGTGASRYANIAGGVDGDQDWGVHHPREMASGDLVAAVRTDATLIDMKAYKSGIAMLPAGPVEPREVTGFGAIFGNGGGHAMCPEPLADGRILLSYGAQETGTGGHEERPQFDLHVIDGDLDPASLQPVVLGSATDELDAVAVVERQAVVVADTVPTAPTEDPRVGEGTTATLVNEDIYADMPLQYMERLSPKPYSVASVVFYDDSQQFHYDDNPQLSKQMPIRIKEVPIAADGSFTAEVPADRPFFFQLVSQTGVGARTQYTPRELGQPWTSDAHFVTVHDFLRPGTEARCRGCHAGHMLHSEIALSEARVNLARLASVWHQERFPSPEIHVQNAPFRAIDQRLAEPDNALGWVARDEPVLNLFWKGQVTVDQVVLYPLPSESDLTSIRVVTDSGAVTAPAGLRSGDPPLVVELGGHTTLSLALELQGTGAVGMAEVVIHGELPETWPEVSLRAPQALALDPHFELTWEPLGHAGLGGYELRVLDEAGALLETLDIGLVTRHTKQLEGFEQGQTLCLELQGYDLLGRVTGAISDPVCGPVPRLRVDSIEPDALELGEVTQVVVKGEGFRDGGDLQLSIGGFKLLEFTVESLRTIRATTRADRPREAGPQDVSVSYDNGLRADLAGGLTVVERSE